MDEQVRIALVIFFVVIAGILSLDALPIIRREWKKALPQCGTALLLVAVLAVIAVFAASLILGPTPEPYHELTGCLRGVGTPTTYSEQRLAQCLTQQASWTPTPPWWQFWNYPIATATP